ncbi:peptidylprolyl isomerase [Methyloligella solikamskensis]|uniref:Peptidyl-prolyl cis-trans isomerase n=1 Tax=Methyloligella solikamskensis TaxID=1177756 RepID=A0ABW3JAI0_9HYPH
MIFARIALVAGLLFAFAPVATTVQAAPEKTLENTVLLDLKDGRVTILLRPDLAPNHVERIKKLTREGFYDGIVFHRVLDGFMAQTGDPTGTGMGGSDYPDVAAEFSNEPFVRGTVGAARSQDPDSANSQFFIMFDEASSLNGQYTVWGEVVDGMEHVDAIKRGAPPSGTVQNPDKIVKMQIAADADAASQEKAKQALQQ